MKKKRRRFYLKDKTCPFVFGARFKMVMAVGRETISFTYYPKMGDTKIKRINFTHTYELYKFMIQSISKIANHTNFENFGGGLLEEKN